MGVLDRNLRSGVSESDSPQRPHKDARAVRQQSRDSVALANEPPGQTKKSNLANIIL